MNDIGQDALHELAREAVIYALPVYEMARMRAATCPRRDDAGQFAGKDADSTLRWVNHVIRPRELLGPRHRQVVTPNNDTLYVNAWIDLSRGPVVLHVPDSGGRYYVLGLLDFYTNPFAYVGSRTTGTQAGDYLLHGPGWRGDPPDGASAIACPTNAVWMIGRVLVDGPEDLAAAHRMQDGVTLTGLSGQSTAFAYDVAMQPNAFPGDARSFAEVVNRALQENPPPAQEAATTARFARVGIGAGLDAMRLTQSQLSALEAAIKSVLALLDKPVPSDLGGGWSLPVEIRESFGTRYLERAQVARNYIGALGMEEAMYLIADRDGDGEPLDGRHAYRFEFPAGGLPGVDAFWSVTMYDKRDCMLVENPLARYSLGDRSPGLRHARDGSLCLHLSAAPPDDPGLRDNWLPAPAGPFYVALRLYVPRPAHLDKTFTYPPIRRLGGAI